MNKFLKFILYVPGKVSLEHKKAYYVVLFGAPLALSLHCIFFWLFYRFNIIPLYYYNYFSITVFCVIFLLNRQLGLANFCLAISTVEVITHQVLAVFFLGWDYGFQYYLITVAGYVLLGHFKRLIYPIAITAISLGLLSWLFFWGQYQFSPHYYMPKNVQSMLYWLNLMSASILVAILSLIFAITANKNEEMLYIAATIDPLTKLSNRRKTIDLIEYEEIRTRRSKKSFALAIGDIDDFKNINDTYGHNAGDAVLVSVAETLKRTLRAQDVIGRWGGEEFMILLPETGLSGGKLAMERVRGNILRMPVKINSSSIRITMTFGIASSEQAANIDQLIKLADDALYEGKRGGKNCVVVSNQCS